MRRSGSSDRIAASKSGRRGDTSRADEEGRHGRRLTERRTDMGGEIDI
jgi:hypothetical protein